MPLGGYHIYVVILSPFTWSIYSNHLGQQSSGISTYNAWAPVFVPLYGPKSVTIIASCHFSLTEFMGKGGGWVLMTRCPITSGLLGPGMVCQSGNHAA